MLNPPRAGRRKGMNGCSCERHPKPVCKGWELAVNRNDVGILNSDKCPYCGELITPEVEK